MAKLIVEVLNARDLLPTDHHGSARPFVEVDFNGHRQRTQTKIQDLYPTWNDKLVFDIQNPRNLHNSIIQVTLYDDHPASYHKEFLGCVQIYGTSVSLLESEAVVQRYPLCKRGSFSHGRGDIALRIYTVRAQNYYYENQQPRHPLRIERASTVHEVKDHDSKTFEAGGADWEDMKEFTLFHFDRTISGASPYDESTSVATPRRESGSDFINAVTARMGLPAIHFSPNLCYLRICIIEARDLAPFYKNNPPEFEARLRLRDQVGVTKISKVFDGNPVWNEEKIFVVSEDMRDDFLIIKVADRITFKLYELIGKVVVPLSSIPRRFDSTKPLQPRWFTLNEVSSSDREGFRKKKQGKILLKLCLEAGYHVSDCVHGDFQPTAKHLKKDSIGRLQLTILSARGLPPMKKQIDGEMNSTDAYCVVKYGNKWVRTRTVINSQEPSWNEQNAWEVYDPCTVIRIGIFDDCMKDKKDTRIGKVCIQLQTLEVNRIHTHYYPLLVLRPSRLKNHGELQLAVQFTGLTWSNMVSLYTKPLLPRMHYLQPFKVEKLHLVQNTAADIVAAHLSKANPPIKKEIARYMLDNGYPLWSMRKQKANFNRLITFVLGIASMYRWFDEIRHWRNPSKTIVIHFLYLVFVWYPKLILPTFFLSLSIMGLWNYRFRSRKPPYLDALLSQAETIDPDQLDEEFDSFPTSQGDDTVKRRYDRLRIVSGRYQTVYGDIATLGERVMAILTCTDTRATSIFAIIAFFWVVFIYMVSIRVVATLLGLYSLRHPRLRTTTPSLLVNLFNRLPSKMDVLF